MYIYIDTNATAAVTRPTRSESKLLFHGTTASVAAKVAAAGFNRSFSRRAALGRGVYFSRRSEDEEAEEEAGAKEEAEAKEEEEEVVCQSARVRRDVSRECRPL